MATYTPKMVAELRSNEKMNYADAVAFASTYGLPIKSVIAKISALGILYTKKDPKTWGQRENEEPTKTDYVNSIVAVIGDLPSLSRMTIVDLAKLKRFMDGISQN